MSLITQGLAFDAGPHTYTFNGQPVPGVTMLLDKLHTFAGVPEDVLERARHRGSFVHRMCELDDLGDLVEDESIEPYRGYLEAWRSFRTLYAPNWEGIEERGYSRLFGYAGTLDRRGVFESGPHPGLKVLPDIKTSEESHWCWGVQTAAYRQILLEHHRDWALARRCTIQLFKTGRVKLLYWDDPDDWTTFQALLHLHHRSESKR